MFIDYSFLFDFIRDSYAKISYYNPSGKVIVPLRYFIDITYRCNLACPYCYIGDERQREELSTQDWKKVIDQIPLFGIISIIGGEPLVRKDFLEVYEYASKRCPRRVNLYTNAVLLNEESMNSFIKNKLLSMSFSLDGTGETHDRLRNCKGAYDKIINNVLELQNRSKHKAHIIYDVKTILHPDNMDEMPLLYELCGKNGWEFLSVTFLRTVFLKQNSTLRPELTSEFTKPLPPVKLYFDFDKFKDVFKEIEKMSKHYKTRLRWAPKFKPFKNYDDVKKFFDKSEANCSITEMFEPCCFPFSNIYINPSGNIYPCLSIDMGNVKEHSIMEIVNSPKFIKFRKQLRDAKLFNGCQLCCESHFKKSFFK